MAKQFVTNPIMKDIIEGIANEDSHIVLDMKTYLEDDINEFIEMASLLMVMDLTYSGDIEYAGIDTKNKA